ncbi:MAG TPA: MetQ/NlpA family ABC transporter substrate-binding protein [Paenalcaligenes sp.]|nr:MetQ/NlpA family ABC transporter substrate-binding protein [Paenalcaligenes sp.]
MIIKQFKKLAFAGALGAVAVAFSTGVAADTKTIKIGVTPGPHAEIMEQVKEIAADRGLEIQILEFSDYVQPNAALEAGDLDANSYQHEPYLQQQVQDRGYRLVSAAPTVIYPLGLYSNQLEDIDQIEDRASIAIPNDPSNGGRALMLLEETGLLELKDGVGAEATLLDVVENPKNLRIVELDAAQLPRSLDDVALAAINTNFAMEAGLVPVDDALVLESSDSPYANLIVVREEDKDADWVKTLVESYHTPEIKEFILDNFEGSLIPVW